MSQFDVQHIIRQPSELLLIHSDNSRAEVLMHVRVTGAGGKHLYSRLVFGQDGSDQDSDQQTLDLALQEALRDLFADPSFIGAIVAAEHVQPNTR